MSRTHRLVPGLLAALLMWPLRPGCAQELPGISDPTRPPAGLRLKHADAAGAPALSASAAEATEAASAASAASAAAVAASAIDLRAIRYDVGQSEGIGEGIALINGQWVRAGDKVKGMRIVSIAQDAVLLSGPRGVRTLKLFAELEDNGGKPARTARRGRKEMK